MITCKAIPLGAATECGGAAVAGVIARCANGHQGPSRPMCQDCLNMALFLPLSCHQCQLTGLQGVPITMLVGDVPSGDQ